jgi:hypothetical protein
MDIKFIVGLSVIVGLFFTGRRVLKRNKWLARKELFESEFPQDWLDILKLRFPLYKKLPEDLQKQLQGNI